jgi:Family of unknown function (DUF6188)
MAPATFDAVAAQRPFQENDDGWTIALRGREVTMCSVDYAFTLSFWALEEPDAWLRIEQPFRLEEPSGRSWTFDPENDRRELGPALGLFGKKVARLFVSRHSGDLDLSFTDETRLTVAPHPKFEAWDLSGPGSLKLVCMPGGGEPAMWL